MSAQFDYTSLDNPFEADWPVYANVPQNGGTTERQKFTIRFRLLTSEEVEKLALEADPWAIAKAYIVSLVDGPEATDAMKEKLLKREYVAKAIAQAYAEFRTGSAAKN